MKIKDKVIVVTGASDGIGKEIALRLAKEGTKLALLARNTERLELVAKAAREAGAQEVNVYSCDISKSDQIAQAVSQITSDFPSVHVIINNAGVWQKLSQLDDIEDAIVHEVIATNLTGMILLSKKLMPTLRKQDEAAIINVASKSGITAQDGQSVYTASKYGVRGFTDVLKSDLKDSSIRVAGVYQSGTNTQMFAKSNQDFPVETFSEPADLADIIAYMLMLPPKIWLHDVRVEKC